MQAPFSFRSAAARIAQRLGLRRPGLAEGPTEEARIPETAPSVIRLMLLALAVILVAESAIMLCSTSLVPGHTAKPVRALADASLPTLLLAPAVWHVIIAPARQVALSERAKVTSIVQTAAHAIVTFGVIVYRVGAGRRSGFGDVSWSWRKRMGERPRWTHV